MRVELDLLVGVALETGADLIIEILAPSPYKRRLMFVDKSFLDIYLSASANGLYAFHFERRHLNGEIFRIDNYPHHRILKLKSFPHHFHAKQDERVQESAFGTKPEEILSNFLVFIRERFYK